MEQTNNDAAAAAKMPTFLKVLCILSFVGIGLSLIGGIMNYFTYSALASGGGMLGSAMAGEAGEHMNDAMNAMGGMLGLDFGKMATCALIQSVLNIPILIGVIMMWKRKKTGYYVYAVFELVQPAMPLFMGLGLAGGIMATLGLIFGILFVILYGVNLKHMS